jgi:hypothetical protein
VIRIPIDFHDGDGPTKKLFVVLGHESNSCICVKATSKIGVFRASDQLLAGVVLFKAGEEGFPLETAIDPNNIFAMDYQKLRGYFSRRDFELMGVLGGEFKRRMAEAITNSVTIPRLRKPRILAVLGDL